MNAARILFRREIRSWLLEPSFYMMGAVFLVVTGITFWMFAVTMAGKEVLTSEITFSGMMFWMAFLAVASAISVKLLGDDHERGTMELLLTAPVSELEVVVGKTLSGFHLAMLLALPAVLYPWSLRAMYPDWSGLDLAMWLAGVLLLALVAGLMTLAGMFWSQVFRRQNPAMVATFLTGVLVVFRGSLRSWIGGAGADGSTGFVAVASHIASFSAGLVDSRAVVFYLAAMAVLVFVNVRILQLARYRRGGGGLNVAVSFLLAGILAGMVNYVAWLHPVRVDVSAFGGDPLEVKVQQILKTVKSPVRLTLLAPSGDSLATTARREVEKYRHVHPSLDVEIVDQGNDLGRARELVSQYKVRESPVLVVACGPRYKVLSLQAMERTEGGNLRVGQRGSTFAARLEAEMGTALRFVSREAAPVVYFLTGHDERGIADFAEYRGYSELAGIVRERYAEIRPLLLEASAPVPADCAALVVAGPARGLAAWEVAKIRDYLGRNGRLMMLLDSGLVTGLEPLLEDWGVQLGQDRVIDAQAATLLPVGRDRASALGLGEVPVIRYGKHPITDGLDGLVSTFVLPRSVEPLAGSNGVGSLNDQADKPRVVPLAFSSGKSWAEGDANQNPPQYNEGYDRRGPVSLAVCVEKGVPSEITMDIKPVRLVVFGDSQFAANRCLSGGNETVFVNALEWLLERDPRLVMGSGQSGLYNLQIQSDGRIWTFMAIVVAPPAGLLGLALFIRMARRDRRVAGGAPNKGKPDA